MIHTVKDSFSPLLVRRCNSTAAGLGYLEVGWVAHEKFPIGQ
jgi:hypothetical protein